MKLQQKTVEKLRNLSLEEWRQEKKHNRYYYRDLHRQNPQLHLLDHILTDSSEIITEEETIDMLNRRTVVRNSAPNNTSSSEVAISQINSGSSQSGSNSSQTNELAQLYSTIGELYQKQSQAEGKIKEFQRDLDLKVRRITELEQNSGIKDNKITEMDTSIKNLKGNVETLQKESADLLSAKNELVRKISQMETEYKNIPDIVRSLIAVEINKLRLEIEKKSETNDQLLKTEIQKEMGSILQNFLSLVLNKLDDTRIKINEDNKNILNSMGGTMEDTIIKVLDKRELNPLTILTPST